MIREASTIDGKVVTPRGWDALEIKLKDRGLSSAEIQEARKSFFEGIETLMLHLICAMLGLLTEH